LISPCSAELSFIGAAAIPVSEFCALKLKGEKFFEENKMKARNLRGVKDGDCVMN
jgi:hypothetical protein